MASGNPLQTIAPASTAEPEPQSSARSSNEGGGVSDDGPEDRGLSHAQGLAGAGAPGGAPEASALDRFDQLLQGEGEILDLIASGAGLDFALERIALLVERIARPALCSIHLLDPESKALGHGAAPSLPADVLRIIDGPETGPEASPCHAAACRREMLAVADLEAESRWSEFRERALANGLRAACAQPILDLRGQVLGVLALHYQVPHQSDAGSHRLVEAMASLSGFAIKHEKREQSRRFADQRFASLSSTIPGVVYQRLVTPEGDIRYTYISEGTKDLFGVSPEEVLADPQALFDCHGPEYRATFRERLLEASRELSMWDVEAQIITRDGEEKWTHAIARPHRLTDGSVLWDGVILDNTWIKKVEFELRKAKETAEATSRAYTKLLTKLRSANERFASLAASIPGVVYQRLVTPEGDIRYTYISEGTTDLFGVSPEEILADPQALFDCHGPQYRATFRERLLEASRKLEMWDVEAQLITRDGEEKWTHAIARPHRLPDGSVLWDGVILDNTWIKKVEFELRKAKEAAEASSTAKTAFLAQISHELRTPLNAIIGFSEIVQTQCFGPLGDEKYIDYVNHINASGIQLSETINDIIEFTKLETGEARLFESKVDISETLDVAIKQIMPFAELTKINISGFSDENLPFVYGDAGKITKIVTNLLSNAVKFTPQGGDVTVAAKIDDAGDLVITITDTGIGIPPEDIAKIFEAFGQIESDLNRRYEGLGLGIPLAVKMAKLHGAHLTFDSAVGVGTTAAFVFPGARVLNRPDKGASALPPQLTLNRDRDEKIR